jgi:hypothetical protein
VWNNLPAHVFGTLWGTASGKLGGLFGVVPVFFRQRNFYPVLAPLSFLYGQTSNSQARHSARF